MSQDSDSRAGSSVERVPDTADGAVRPDVSIIIVCYNDREVLLPCLTSIFESRFEVSHEVLLVDNGSVDGSQEEALERHPDVRLVEAGYNSGYAGGNNIGYRASRGRFVLFLNPDTLLCDGVLDRLVERYEALPGCGAVGPNVRNADGSLQRSVFRSPRLVDFWDSFMLKRVPGYARLFGFMGYRDEDYANEGDVDVVCGCCFLVGRPVLEEVGCFDEEYFIYFEEADLCERIRAAGHRVVYTPATSIVHLGGATTVKQQTWFRIRAERSRRLFFRKHRGPLATAALWPALFLNSLARVSIGLLALALTLGAVETVRVKTGCEVALLLWQFGLVNHPQRPPAPAPTGP